MSKWMHYIALFGAVLLWSGCVKDFQPSAEGYEKKLVINSSLTPGFPIKISVTEVVPIEGNNTAYSLQDVQVELFEDGVYKERLSYFPFDSGGVIGYYISSFNVKEGSIYSVKASLDGYPKVSATDTVPTAFRTNLSHIYSIPDSLRDTIPYKFLVSITDNGFQRNTYFIQCIFSVNYTYYDEATHDTITRDAIFGAPSFNRETSGTLKRLSNGYLYTSDDAFNGMNRNFMISFDNISPIPFISNSATLLVVVRSVSPAWASYEISIDRYFGRNFNVFSQPRELFSNVNGGYGIFSGNTYYMFPIRIK